MNEHEPTRQERREERRDNQRKVLDNRRSVRLQAILSTRPPKHKPRRRP